MKIKMQKKPTVEQWAKMYNVDVHIAKAYQRARRNWMNRNTAYARKHGTPPTAQVPADVRTFAPTRSFRDTFEMYIESKAAGIANESAHFAKMMEIKQRSYLANVASVIFESEPDSDVALKLQKFLPKAKPKDVRALVTALGGKGIAILHESPKTKQRRFRSLDEERRRLQKDGEDYETSAQFDYTDALKALIDFFS